MEDDRNKICMMSFALKWCGDKIVGHVMSEDLHKGNSASRFFKIQKLYFELQKIIKTKSADASYMLYISA
jgi:hypothetical protein